MLDRLMPGQRRMFAWIEALPDQLAASGGFAGLDDVAPLPELPARMLCCGMGGSAMAASLLADGWPQLEVPVLVWRDDDLPDWAGPETLIVACSHSGETAETLSAVAAARRRGCPLVAITSGGRLLDQARGQDGPGFAAVRLPGGQPPRTALGASLGALLHATHRLGLLPDPSASIAAAVAAAKSGAALPALVGGVPGDAGEAGEADLPAWLAERLHGRFVVIFTSGLEAHGAGRRLLAQLQENAKAPGHVAAFPELNHNEIVGWNLDAGTRDRFALVVLRGTEDTAAAQRVAVAIDLLREQFAGVHELSARGPDHLARTLGLILAGDLASAHLAVLGGVDPVPIARIDALKARLAGR